RCPRRSSGSQGRRFRRSCSQYALLVVELLRQERVEVRLARLDVLDLLRDALLNGEVGSRSCPYWPSVIPDCPPNRLVSACSAGVPAMKPPNTSAPPPP